ncbi:hypothetical protein RJ640_001390 [Escallonia rubra]|uniref:Uncharacterized protein n=1 Tax=Escallonia rubra TaxID=112253 RepID=A0AA88QQ96_9ASTE|nr:hypothetical protein RJ640_001390 [Escallonia rubra]
MDPEPGEAEEPACRGHGYQLSPRTDRLMKEPSPPSSPKTDFQSRATEPPRPDIPKPASYRDIVSNSQGREIDFERYMEDSTTSNNDHIIDTALVHLSIPQTIFNRFHALPKEIHVKLLKSGTGNIHLEINTLKQAID